jgi:hypothetical protein
VIRGQTPQRLLIAGGATMLGVFAVIAFIFRRADGSQDTLSLIGGLMAYAFIAFAIVILVMGWRRRGELAARETAQRYLRDHDAVGRAVGRPVRVHLHQGGRVRPAETGQVNVAADVAGPLGSAEATVVLAKVAEHWEPVGGELVAEQRTVRLGADARA